MSTYPVVSLVAAIAISSLVAVPAAQTAQPPASGIFLEEGGAATKQVLGTYSTDFQQHGVAKSILTQGFSKPSVTVRHPGATADFVITDPSPVFLFRFAPPPSRNQPPPDPMQALAAMSSGAPMPVALTGKSPKEYGLLRMTVDGEARVVDSKHLDIYKLDAQPAGTLEFHVRPVKPLEPGEYAFFMIAQAQGGTAPTQIWAFSLHKPAL